MSAIRDRSRRLMPRTVALFAALAGAACDAEGGGMSEPASDPPIQQTAGQRETLKIRLRIGETVRTATLEGSAAARDFAALLPLTLALKDYASTEKIADLPRALSTEGTPVAIDPVAGDLTYFAPWGNLALFYRDGHRSPGLVRLGRVDSGAEGLGSLEGPVTIEAAE